mgnify:CR=1 FL=1
MALKARISDATTRAARNPGKIIVGLLVVVAFLALIGRAM